MEPTSWPLRHADFPEWLIPARENIQRELVRIKGLLAALPETANAVHASLDEGRLNMMLGAAISLWRTVFPAGHHYDQETSTSGALELVNKVTREDAVMQTAALDAWLLGYYLSDARLRLVEVEQHWPRPYLSEDFYKSYRLMETGPSQPMFTPRRWGQCFDVLHCLLVAYKRRAEPASADAQAETRSADRKPKQPPVIVGCTDGTYAILQSDGSAASFVNGKWEPGIAFDNRDFLDMSVIGNVAVRSLLLTMASEALAKSRAQ